MEKLFIIVLAVGIVAGIAWIILWLWNYNLTLKDECDRKGGTINELRNDKDRLNSVNDELKKKISSLIAHCKEKGVIFGKGVDVVDMEQKVIRFPAGR